MVVTMAVAVEALAVLTTRGARNVLRGFFLAE